MGVAIPVLRKMAGALGCVRHAIHNACHDGIVDGVILKGRRCLAEGIYPYTLFERPVGSRVIFCKEVVVCSVKDAIFIEATLAGFYLLVSIEGSRCRVVKE